ncbi:ATP-grasp domain-containing protein [Flavobacterium foetidum]|uniref:carboxylate--amine ligase n=1 Tax=Flavobacterium foetidum TaxID=2026681 RepID=UPI001074C4D4|nr:carboxylate--amine ligase [Flavobacterium foetidum]KAF2513529.1 carboxylate--amine ligase [Flavobacterium foetidum]
MKKILIGGAGGAPSEGVINSLLRSKKGEEIIGMGSDPTDLVLSSAKKKYALPYADSPEYLESLLGILNTEKPDLIHFQNDLEVFYASQYREQIHATGTKTFMPDHDVIDTCVHKYKTYLKLKEANVKVPTNILLNNEENLLRAFEELGDEEGKIWLRASSIGGGGKGALPTNDFTFAKGWIERYNGWGDFIAAELLTPETVTWLSIWHEGELIVAQTRIRKGWTHGNRTVSGVTGVTKVGQTFSDKIVDEVAINTVKAVSDKPHGIFGVDMAYDKDGFPNPTEINISRFFTTVLFFTEAGLNMPEIFKDLALYGEKPDLNKIINPLPDGLLWLRGMDTIPRIFNNEQIRKEIINL